MASIRSMAHVSWLNRVGLSANPLTVTLTCDPRDVVMVSALLLGVFTGATVGAGLVGLGVAVGVGVAVALGVEVAIGLGVALALGVGVGGTGVGVGESNAVADPMSTAESVSESPH